MELAVATLLRPFVAEHWTGVEHLLREGLRETVAHQSTADPCSALRPQRDCVAAAIFEAVHLFRHNIGSLTERSGEHTAIFEDWGGPFVEAISTGDQTGSVHDAPMATLIFTDQIMSAAGRVKFGYHLIQSAHSREA